jgi:hypothetical protein
MTRLIFAACCASPVFFAMKLAVNAFLAAWA